MEEHGNIPALILPPPSSGAAANLSLACLASDSPEPAGEAGVLGWHCWQTGDIPLQVYAGKVRDQTCTTKASQDDGFGRQEPQPRGYNVATPGQTADNSLHQLRGWQERVQLLC